VPLTLTFDLDFDHKVAGRNTDRRRTFWSLFEAGCNRRAGTDYSVHGAVIKTKPPRQFTQEFDESGTAKAAADP